MIRFFLLFLMAAAGVAQEAPLASPGAPNPNRYLLVVEVSKSMERLDRNLRQTFFDLVYSGLNGHMVPGDSYGVWLYGEENNTAFPMQIWEPKDRLGLASKATLYLKGSEYQGKARLDKVISDLAAVLSSVRDVTILFLTDGNTPMHGTPFDAKINAVYARDRDEMRLAGKPFITVLVARDGGIAAWGVYHVPQEIALPRRVPKPAPTTETTSPPPTTQEPVADEGPAANKPEVVNQQPRREPIIINKETMAAEKAQSEAGAEAALTKTNSATAEQISGSGSISTASAVPVDTNPDRSAAPAVEQSETKRVAAPVQPPKAPAASSNAAPDEVTPALVPPDARVIPAATGLADAPSQANDPAVAQTNPPTAEETQAPAALSSTASLSAQNDGQGGSDGSAGPKPEANMAAASETAGAAEPVQANEGGRSDAATRYLWFAGGLFLLAVAIGYVMYRFNSREERSLITRSMNRR